MPVPHIQPDSFLTLHYRLAGPTGADVINTFIDKPATLSMGTGQLSPALEQRLLGLPEGARQLFQLEAGAAFGQRSAQMMQRVKLALLREMGDAEEDDYHVGDVLEFPTPDGKATYAGVIREIGPAEEDWALFDFNHPLAGLPVTFEVQVIGVL
jgi:FKBP-type peptidyl-prolyl cis-trans isomerase SlpA